MTDLLKLSTSISIELHALCLLMVLLLRANMRKGLKQSSMKGMLPLDFVYIGCAVMIVSDCLWSCVSSLGKPSNCLAYAINLLYFYSSSVAVVCWFLFCTNQLGKGYADNKRLRIGILIFESVMLLLYTLSVPFGWIFSIQDGVYVRGKLFLLDPILKMSALGLASVLSIFCKRQENAEYMRRKDLRLASFCVPLFICGALQSITGVDFDCLGATVALLMIFVTGVTDSDKENTDALYSLADSFEASYIVNMDTGMMRALHRDVMHDAAMPGMASLDYRTHFPQVLNAILMPEDRITTLDTYSISNLQKRFQIDNAFSIRYRVKENSGQTALHMATFVHAPGAEGKQEFLLGINTVHTDSLLYERNETLSRENQKLELINTGIIESVAKIVEARDSGSGGHIVRVKKLTEIIAKELMIHEPDLKLDSAQVKLIASASVLHDIGKIVIPDAVLLKPGPLTKDEFEIMKTHSTKGCDILNLFPLGLDDAFLECALSICRWHHEKYDGRGYPDGLTGEAIPIAAQIVAAADCLDALVSDRPYKKAFSPEKAFEMIKAGECGAFSPKILRALEKQKTKLTELTRLYK